MTTTNKKIAVGYVRVSTDMQVTEGHSIEAQQNQILDYCRYHKLEFFRFYKDEGKSGKNMARDDLNLMLEELQPGYVVVAISISRISRSIKDILSIVDIIKSKGASLTLLDLNVDTSTPSGDFMLNVMASVSQFERLQTSQRVSDTLNNMSREGKLIVKPRFGYKVIKDGKVSQVVEDPDEQAVITIIRNILQSDPKATATYVARMLSGQGIKIRKSKVIRPDYVRKIIEANNLRPVIKHVFLPGPNYI